MASRRIHWMNVALLIALAFAGRSLADDKVPDEPAAADHDFQRDVVPFLNAYCMDCHSGDEAEAQIRFDRYQESSNIQQDFPLWEKVLRMLRNRQMPPVDANQPPEDEVRAELAAIERELATFDCRIGRRPGRVTIRRLNRAEYDRTVQDLFGLELHPARDFPSDDVGLGFDNIADVLSIPPILLEKYLNAAESVVEQVFANDEARKRIFVHEPTSDSEPIENLQRDIFQFAERAFRRPLTDGDRDRLRKLAREALEVGVPHEEIAKTMCVAVLVSPHFLFRIERDPEPDDEDGIRELNDWEVASRLSYFLWSSMPDEELFELARNGELLRPEQLEAQVRRMLASPKADALVDHFAGQWLQLRDVASRTPDPGMFPEFDDALREAMRLETETFFAHVMRDNRSVLEFLNADYTFVNERLARHYGLQGVEGDDFQRVPLPEQRRGVLTHASILLITSNPTRTSPVKRGKWIMDNILGEPPPPPPPDVPELETDAEALGSLRERMVQHRANPSCAVCHLQMDVLGFGMENFDVVGSWRDRDGRYDIDPSGVLPDGTKFAGPADLMSVLANEKKEAFCRCLTEKLLIYALGRGLEPYDRCAVNEILERLEQEEYRFQSLVTGIVLSEPFLKREALGDK